MHTVAEHLLVGCSFTDPLWQKEVPWSVEYSKFHQSYIVAKAGMGIKGLCTEALRYLDTLPSISKLVIMLPTLWRLDVEMDQETYLCNAMVDLLYADPDVQIVAPAVRKWITSGGLNYPKNTEQSVLFDFLYKHQGFLVIAKEHFQALKLLLNCCRERKIRYYVSAIQDPMDQLQGLDYIRDDVVTLLNDVEYDQWLRFNGNFVEKFLGHEFHPTTQEHQILCQHILNVTE